jgi:spore maturation protein CgeB
VSILFVGDLSHEGTSGAQRYCALKSCIPTVAELDIAQIDPCLGRFTELIAKSLRSPSIGFNATATQNAIQSACIQSSPDVLWLEWPRYCTPEFLKELKSAFPKMQIVSFQDDNPFGERKGDVWMWKDYLRSIPHFDIQFVKRTSDLMEIKSRGGHNCHLWMHGVYSPIFFPSGANEERLFPLSFVGTCMDGRDRLIEALLVSGVDVHVFGTHWERRSSLPVRFPRNFHSAVRGLAYGDVLRRSHACLGLVSHSNHDEWTMRTFEVPGCASLFLAQDTPTHRQLFTPDEEAVFFRSIDDCVRLAKKFTADLDSAKQIALAGRRKIEDHGWFLENRMKEILPLLGVRNS